MIRHELMIVPDSLWIPCCPDALCKFDWFVNLVDKNAAHTRSRLQCPNHRRYEFTSYWKSKAA